MSRLARYLGLPAVCVAFVGLLGIALTFGEEIGEGIAGSTGFLVGQMIVLGAATLHTGLLVRRGRGRGPEEAQVLRAVADGVSEVVFVKDVQGKYLYINRAGAEILGRAPGEIVGHCSAEFFPPHVARALDAACEPVLRTGQRHRVEHDVPTPLLGGVEG